MWKLREAFPHLVLWGYHSSQAQSGTGRGGGCSPAIPHFDVAIYLAFLTFGAIGYRNFARAAGRYRLHRIHRTRTSASGTHRQDSHRLAGGVHKCIVVNYLLGLRRHAAEVVTCMVELQLTGLAPGTQ